MEDNLRILFDLVKEEADNLKKYATRKEIDRLNFYEVNPHSKTKCIYGQMTGNCISDRAEELIYMCCTNVYDGHDGRVDVDIKDAKLIGPPTEHGRFICNFKFFTPIEKFLYVADFSQIKKLVLYLKNITAWEL